MAILNIETATSVCSVALSEKDSIVFSKESYECQSHAALLGVFVEEAVREASSKGVKVDAVSVSSGPGSYTGLRIGVSMAKGLCFGWNVPLIGVHTLDIMAAKIVKNHGDDSNETLFCPMIDARRMEVYAAIYDSRLNVVRETKPDVVTAETYSAFLENRRVCFFGNGAAKCRDVIKSPNAVFIDDVVPLAKDMSSLSWRRFEEKKFEDVAYFEPFYLKDFIATIPKNKVL